MVERREEALVARAQGQRQVQVGALAGPCAAFLAMAPEEGVEGGRIGVNRDRQHVAAGPEDALGAVAVMDVDVEDRDPLVAGAQPLGGDRAVVEEAEAAGHVGEGVVARRPAQRIGGALALGDQGRRRDRDVGGQQRRLEGARADRAGGIGHVPAGAPDDAVRITRRIAARMDVGDDLGRSVAERRPGVVGLLEKQQIVRAVHGRDRPAVETLRRDDGVAARLQPRQQPLGALRLLRAPPRLATDQEELRVVDEVSGIVDGFHDA